MKRLLSLMIVCAVMCSSLIVPTVSADVSYADHVVGEMPANMLKTASEMGDASSWWANMGTTSNKISRGQTNSYKWTTIKANGTPGGTMTGDSAPSYLINGVYAGANIIKSNSSSGFGGDIDDGKDYVYAVQVRNCDSTYTPNVRFLLFDLDGYVALNAVEWGSEGMPVTSTDWMDFKGSIRSPERNKSDTANDVDRISIGFNDDTIAGSKIEINFTDTSEGMYQMYFAEEEAYDITNELTSESSYVTPLQSATFKAQLTNQVGLPGYLDQTFVWKVLDRETRSKEIEGVTVTSSPDTTTATVTVTEDAEPGLYDVVAYSEAYDMAKGYTITVDTPSKYVDYVPGAIPENLIGKVGGDNYDLQYIGVDNDGSSTGVKVGHTYAEKFFTVRSGAEYDGTTKVGKAAYRQFGAVLSDSILTEKPHNDVTYAVRFSARKNASSPADTKVAFVAHDADNYSVNHASKNYGTAGLSLTSTDWVTYKDVLRIPKKHEQLADRTNNPILETVFPVDALAGTSFDVSWKYSGTEEFYLAEEAVYDITNTITSGSSDVTYGDTVKLEASVVNQIGIEGYLEQNFTWAVVDAETRKIKADGITVTPSRDTATATVFIGENTAPGKYAIAAFSEDYKIARAVIITVKSADMYDDYVPVELSDNIVANNNDANNFTGRWLETFEAYAPTHANGVTGAMRYPMVASPQYWGDSSTTPVAGGEMTKAIGTYLWKADTNYVFSTDLKNNPASGVNNTRFIYMIDSRDGTTTSRPYYTANITSDSQWQNFRFMLHVDAAGTSKSALYYGYPNHSSLHNPKGTDILHRLGSFYVAEEKPHDIQVTASDDTITQGEGNITLNAKILNQIGLEYSEKANINWYVTNKYRTKVVEGFDIIKSIDGKKIVLSAPKTVSHGKYVVFAEDSTKGVTGFRKGIEITVKPYDMDLTDEGALIYVAPYGDDDSFGTKDEPLATFEGAISKIKELEAKDVSVAQVIFRGGDYRVNGISIDETVSGINGRSIVFRSYEGEKACFKGSAELDMSKAKHITDTAILDRMYPSVHDKVVVIDLEEQGISQSEITELTNVNSIYSLKSTGDYNTIYVNNVEQPIAQWPNGREYTTWTPKYEWYISSSLKGDLYPHQMGYADGDAPDRWSKASQWWVSVFPEWDFTRYRLSPESIDTSKNIIYYPESTVSLTSTVSRRWKAYNLLEEIDLPGEFMIDRENMLLYFYPPYDTEGAKVEFSVAKTLLSVKNAKNILFKDLNFTQNTSTAVVITNVDNVDFDGCTFTNIGYKGLVNSGTERPVTGANYWQQSYMYKDSSYNCDIRNCLFDNCSGVSLQIVGGNSDTLTPSGNIIENNIITRSNQRSPVDASMLVAGVGNTVRNNNFSKSTQHAITIIGNDHLIENNEIHNVLREVADAGAIYQGRNQMMRGTTISSNLIHDIWPTDSRLVSGTVGIYMDDCQQGNTIKNNFFIGTKTGYNSHGAAAQKVLNNIMVDTNAPWRFHGNPNSSTETTAAGGTNNWDSYDGIAGKVRSTMYDTTKNTDTMETFLSEIEDIDLYRERYPDLATWIDTNDNPHKYTVFGGNVSVDAAADTSNENLLCWDDRTYAQIGTNPTDYTKDIFVDPENLDYRVKSTSAAAIANPGLLSDANFDINTLGLTNGFAIDTSKASFRLLYPANGDAISADSTQLFWEDALLANRYDIIVATDAEFKNIVVSEEVHNNIYDLSSLTPGTRYYWKVIAKNTSRNLKAQWESEVFSFFATDIIIDNTAVIQSGNNISFDMSVSTVGSASYDAKIYVAAYDTYGKFKNVWSGHKTISATTQKFPVSIDTKGEYSVDILKILVWKNDDVTPLRASKILRKK